MLVTVNGVGDIKRFMESKEYNKFIQNGTNIYCVASSDEIGNNINGVNYTRQDFLKKLKINGLDKTSKFIILHYDILAEGIDVPGITGILPMRTLTKSKFLQTFGRSARLDQNDRVRLESGNLKINDLQEYNKPYAWVIIPSIISDNVDNEQHVSSLISELRDYGFNPYEDVVITDDTNGLPEVMNIDNLNDLKKNLPNIGKYIEKIRADYEAERIANLSKNEWSNEVLNMLKTI
jgi:hypothetical protein